MKILLDTQSWLWWIADPEKLNHEALDYFKNSHNELFFSAVSSWEISIKYAIGNLELRVHAEITLHFLDASPAPYVLQRRTRLRRRPLALDLLPKCEFIYARTLSLTQTLAESGQAGQDGNSVFQQK